MPQFFTSIARSEVQTHNISYPHSLIQLIQGNLFHGLPNEDPYAYLATYIEICNTVKIARVEEDSLRGCYPALWHGKNPSNSSTELETTDIQYPTASHIRVPICLTGSGLVSKDLVAVVTSRSACLQMSACHQRGFLSPLEVKEFQSLN